MSAPNVPSTPGYYWFKGTGRVHMDSLEDPPVTEVHGIVSLTWWFEHMEPYIDGDYIDPHSMNGIWDGPLISPFETEEEEPEPPTKDAILVVSVTRSTLAVIQEMALNAEDERQGRKVLDWIDGIDHPETLHEKG